jgi:phosphoglycolate phosphatase-like HAD superfamily hydrolase
MKMTRSKVKVVLFDFDGTLSTLRAGWEEVMIPFMKESIVGGRNLTPVEEQVLHHEIEAYIDQSTGIQTVYQMRWLAEKVRESGWNAEIMDEWGYKAEYNRRLLVNVQERVRRLESGELLPEDYLMKGSLAFLQCLSGLGVEMFVASGTDHPDVVREAGVLQVGSFFKDIVGAPVGRAECSKEKVMKDLMENKNLKGSEFAVIGDGKVEIQLAKEYGSLAIGLASDESCRKGINPVKEKRLLIAGADHITGDFQNQAEWLAWMGY